jgi:glucose-1-phosphate cytidylyltransferase
MSMKIIILAGGYGSRLSEETEMRPKPMVEIGGYPIIWHIMKTYSHYGHNEFIILCGYKGYMIKDYFANYYLHNGDITFELDTNRIKIHNNPSEPWKVTLLDTGLDTMTGGRILRAKPYIPEGEDFLLTYGDGVANVDIHQLIKFHNSHGQAITMTSSQPEGRFGALDIVENDRVKYFIEKPEGDGSWINAGYFVCKSEVFDYITEGDRTVFERSPLQNLARDKKLYTYKHHGFWRPMDTLRDKNALEELWKTGNALWKIW